MIPDLVRVYAVSALRSLDRPPGAIRRNAPLLLPQDILNLADLFLYFAGYFFVFAFGFQFGFHAELPGDLPELTLYFVKLAFRLVLHAGFQAIPPLPRTCGV